MARKKTPKKKVEVVFDAEKRKEFLTGFRKRKNERRTRAKAELAKSLKDERIRIRQEVKEGFKHLKKSFEPLKELTEEDKAEEKQETYEDDEVQVKIVELSTNDLAAQRNMLGANTGEESEEEEKQSESEGEDPNQPDRIPGMDYDPSARKKRKSTPAASETEPKAKKPAAHSEDPDIRSKKDFNKLMKTKTLKKMHKSKVFKQKERLDKQVNLKKAKRDRNNTIKSVPKHQRKKLKYGAAKPTVYSKGRKLNKKEIRRQRGDD